MLVVWEGARLEVEDISDAEQAIEPDTQGMGGELGVAACGETAQAVGVVGLNMQLERKLVVDSLDQLAQMGVQVATRLGGTSALVAARYAHQRDVARGALNRALAPLASYLAPSLQRVRRYACGRWLCAYRRDDPPSGRSCVWIHWIPSIASVPHRRRLMSRRLPSFRP